MCNPWKAYCLKKTKNTCVHPCLGAGLTCYILTGGSCRRHSWLPSCAQGQGVSCKWQTFPVLTPSEKTGRPPQTGIQEAICRQKREPRVLELREFPDMRSGCAPGTNKWEEEDLFHWGGKAGFKQRTTLCKDSTPRRSESVSGVRLQGLTTSSQFLTYSIWLFCLASLMF